MSDRDCNRSYFSVPFLVRVELSPLQVEVGVVFKKLLHFPLGHDLRQAVGPPDGIYQHSATGLIIASKDLGGKKRWADHGPTHVIRLARIAVKTDCPHAAGRFVHMETHTRYWIASAAPLALAGNSKVIGSFDQPVKRDPDLTGTSFVWIL